jgi:hypothetical protein
MKYAAIEPSSDRRRLPTKPSPLAVALDAAVQLAAVFVLEDEGLESGAKVDGRSHSIT